MIGIDEVGRGAWAGPLLVAAVRLHSEIPGLTDSKLLSMANREKLCPVIQAHADIGLGWLRAEEIDRIGLGQALKVCAQQAAAALRPHKTEVIIIDGSVDLLGNNSMVRTAPKAELSYPAVAAASIVAKVFRDRYMTALHFKYPQYALDKHVGYGTSLHLTALQQHGPCHLLHRFSFKPILGLL